MTKAALLNPELLDPEKYDENKVKESAEILLEAEEIKKDEVLMKKVQEYWDKQDGKIKNLKDLKDRANNYVNDKKAEMDDEK